MINKITRPMVIDDLGNDFKVLYADTDSKFGIDKWEVDIIKNIPTKNFDDDFISLSSIKGKKLSELSAQQLEKIFGKEFVKKPNNKFKYQH